MNIFLSLFWTFFKIGLFTIGGGQAMIPLIMTEVVNKGWLTNEMMIDFIAIAESTPGPFAINIATFAGIEVAGIAGGVVATLGVVLPSFVIIVLIVKLFSKQMQKPLVKEVFGGVRAGVVGLLFSVFLGLFLQVIFSIDSIFKIAQLQNVDWIGLGLFVGLFIVSFIKFKGKTLHPIFIILLSACGGLLFYSVIPI